jgi:uncharacterized protein
MAAIRLRLRVSPGANTTALVGQHGDAWKIRVAAPPEDGKANEAVLRLLADRLELPRGSVRLVSGASARDKIVELEGISGADANRRLAAQT